MCEGVTTVNGSEEVIIELLLNSALLSICDQNADESFKSLSKAKDLLRIIPRCNLETIIMLQLAVALFFEEDQQIESEFSYL